MISLNDPNWLIFKPGLSSDRRLKAIYYYSTCAIHQGEHSLSPYILLLSTISLGRLSSYSSDCYSKLPWTESWRSKIRVPAWSHLAEGRLPGLHVEFFRLCPCMEEREGHQLSSTSYKDTNSIMELHPYDLIISQISHLTPTFIRR